MKYSSVNSPRAISIDEYTCQWHESDTVSYDLFIVCPPRTISRASLFKILDVSNRNTGVSSNNLLTLFLVGRKKNRITRESTINIILQI